MRRVVVTGLGMVTSLGLNVRDNWSNIIRGISGISHIASLTPDQLVISIGGEIKRPGQKPNDAGHVLNVEDHIDAKEVKRMDKFMQYAIIAADEALKDANWYPESELDRVRTGVFVGSGIGGIAEIERNILIGQAKSLRSVSPLFVPSAIINLAAGHISIRNKLYGPNVAGVTACASGTHAIYHASHIIKADDADVMVVGGAESPITPTCIAGFASAKTLSKSYQNTPQKASRPWDKNRDGFVIGEGAGIVVLEEYEHAKKRGANIICELYGCGASADGYHITSPHPEGFGAKLAMKMALKNSEVTPDQIGYINAHGTSTPVGDMIEFAAVAEIMKDVKGTPVMSSTKSSIGHLLGAAGAVEAIYSILAMNTGDIPPTLNLDNQEDGTEKFDLMPHKSRNIGKIDCVLSNSFGFGGTNASIIFGKVR